MKAQTKLTVFLLIAIGLKLFCLNIGLFWDNVLFVSKMGDWLFKNGLFNWHFPESFDPGHPPFIAFINALGWKLFGRSLLVSHLMMVPFMVGFMWQLHMFVVRFIPSIKQQWLTFIVLLADPTLLAQFVLISPELIHLFFLFMAINAILRQKPTLKTVALMVLSMVSFRGMMLCAGLFIFDIWHQYSKEKYQIISPKFLLGYLVAAAPAVAFLTFRYFSVGWIFTHPNSPFSETSELVSISGLIRNIAVMLHRFFDFGRIFIWIALIIGVLKFKDSWHNTNFKTLIKLAISISIVIIITSLAISNPMGHRYFIGSYLIIALMLCVIINRSKKWKWFYGALLLLVTTGNFWVYPQRVAQGWDASLACIPYFELRRDMISYMDSNRIPITKTASFFPNINPIDYIDLNNDDRSFIDFTGNEKYLLYSNVYNISDNEFEKIQSDYVEMKRLSNKTVYFTLYQHKK